MVGLAYRTYTGLEKQTRGGHKKPCVHQDPGEKSSDPTALTYSFPHLEQVCCSMSSSNYCFLTCIQISQEADQVVWYSQIFKIFQFVVVHEDFSIVNKVNFFLEFFCFFYDPMDVNNLISGSSAFPKSRMYIWMFMVN